MSNGNTHGRICAHVAADGTVTASPSEQDKPTPKANPDCKVCNGYGKQVFEGGHTVVCKCVSLNFREVTQPPPLSAEEWERVESEAAYAIAQHDDGSTTRNEYLMSRAIRQLQAEVAALRESMSDQLAAKP